MGDLGNDAAAEVFGRLAALEAEHLDALLRRTDGVALPKLSTDQYRWLDAEPPETAAHELVFRLFTPRQALAIALGAEKRAQAFFEHIFMTADDPSLRGLAQEMAIEEQEHVGMVERMLERTPTRASTGKPRCKRRGAHRGPRKGKDRKFLRVRAAKCPRLRRVSGR